MSIPQSSYGDKKIAFVILGMGIGGAEKFLVAVINYFCRHNYQAVLFLLSNNRELVPMLDKRVRIVAITKRSRLDIWVGARIKEQIRKEGIRKVFCVNTYAFFLTRLFFYFDRGTRFYLSLHSTIPFSKKYYWQNLLYFRLIRRNDKVIYLCKNQKQYLKRKYYLLHSNDYVVYNGIDTEYFDPGALSPIDKPAFRKQYHIGEKDKVILMVARLQAEKRHTDAIEALSILHKKYNNPAHLLIVGTGEDGYVRSIRRFSEERNMQSFVHFAGNHQDVRKFYCISDLFTLTSNSETFSLAALEAMAFGLPCSLTNVGGASEMILPGVTGSLSTPEDPLSIADSWNQLLTQNTKSGWIRRYVLQNFNAEQMLEQYYSIMDG